MIIRNLKTIILPTKINRVDDKLYRGNAIFSPIKALKLKQQGVTQVIDLRSQHDVVSDAFKFLERLYCKLLKINYSNDSFYLAGNMDLPSQDFFDKINEKIDKSKKTYIHCHFGLHRTGIAIALYQKSKNVPKEEICDQLVKNDWKSEKENNTLKQVLKTFFSYK